MERGADRGRKKPPNRSDVRGRGQEPDDGLLVTHVNQTRDLLMLREVAQPPAREDSQDWLSLHGLKSERLTVGDLLSQGTVVLEEGSNAVKKVHFSAQLIRQFESKLSGALELYRQRLRWLGDSSRKAFGLVQGTRVGVLIDVAAVGRGLQEELQNDLVSLIDEQLSHKNKLYALSFGSTASALWPEPVEVNESTLQELALWVRGLQPGGGSNLLQALRKAFALKGLNSLVVVLGTCPDQPAEILSDYIQQSALGRGLLTHIITYKCDDRVPPAVLQNLAEAIGGSYHCYSTDTEISSSRDVDELLAEIQRAQSLLGHVQALHHGTPCKDLTSLMKEISTEIAKGQPQSLVPKPPKHEAPLTIEFPNLEKTSAEWLKVHGLKAKKLSLYQVLAPNAFPPVEDFVPILQKTVSSTVHKRAMVQFQWHDGTVKNIHVDPPLLYEYQKQLSRAMRAYERRIEWLSLASRRIWGTVCEKRVVVLLDISATNSMYIIHIQHSLRLLLEEQLSNKDSFNVIAFGGTVESWRPEMVPVSHDNLQSAWRWALTLRCGGSRNVLSALRKAVEVDFKDKDRHLSQGIYLFTGGVPDQDVPAVSAYVAEACVGCDLQLNVCLFYVGEPQMDATVPACYASRGDTATAYREVTRAARGRFHWFGDTGIFESDDIDAIMSEMERALNYSQKCALLVSSLKNQSRKDPANTALLTEKPKQRSPPPKPCRPKPTGPTVATTRVTAGPDGGRSAPRKALTWCPLGGKVGLPPARPGGGEASEPRRRTPRKDAQATVALFYTEVGNSVGSVYKKYPQGRGRRRPHSSIELPKKDAICSSREWVANYGLKKLRMEISRHVGPKCAHQKSVGRPPAARHCHVLPSVEADGVVRHIQRTPQEVDTYIACLEKVTRRYAQRLQWLLSGSRRLFGVILERRVCVLLDTSGSVGPHLPQVKAELTLLIWEQLRKHCDSFNLISFAEDLHLWQDTLVDTTDAACHEATQWVTHLHSQGGTSVLQALLAAFSFHDVQGVYLLTDGKPDTSCSLVLREVQRLSEGRAVRVHTIALTRSGRAEAHFLRSLASLTGGRYHRPVAEDALPHIHGLLTRGCVDEEDPMVSLFEGDDLRRLAQELTKARSFLRQAQSLRSQLQKQDGADPRVAPLSTPGAAVSRRSLSEKPCTKPAAPFSPPSTW